MLVAEAAKSLAKLDAERLEELALSCQALNREGIAGKQRFSAVEVSEAKRDMAVLARVLEVTRTNVAIVSRLRELHAGHVEYSVRQESATNSAEVCDGLD